MKNLTTINHLKQQFITDKFVKRTIYQINKDLYGLSQDSIDIVGLEIDALESLKNKLIVVLQELDKISQLQQFIYIVDLPEKEWVYFMSFQNFEELSLQVVIREAQKVYLREVFKI